MEYSQYQPMYCVALSQNVSLLLFSLTGASWSSKCYIPTGAHISRLHRPLLNREQLWHTLEIRTALSSDDMNMATRNRLSNPRPRHACIIYALFSFSLSHDLMYSFQLIMVKIDGSPTRFNGSPSCSLLLLTPIFQFGCLRNPSSLESWSDEAKSNATFVRSTI